MKTAMRWGCPMVLGMALAGCTLALDFDGLQHDKGAGDIDTEDTDGARKPCTAPSQCQDGIDCTADSCGPDGFCVSTPDNAACGKLEQCVVGQGCVRTANECAFDGDCADAWDCTTDFCSAGLCGYTTHDELCADPTNVCMENRTCDVVEGCIGGYERSCDQPAGPSCYNYLCNPATGACDATELKPGADNDADGYCDAIAIYGGDDCNDESAVVNPGALEVCNLADDNCDTLVDGRATAGPAQVATAEQLSAPRVAFGGDRFAVTWQAGSAEAGTIHVQLLGTGACVIDTACEDIANAHPASAVMDLTAMGGVGTSGTEPAIAANGNQLVVVWIARAAGAPPTVMALTLEITENGLVPAPAAQAISAGGVDDCYGPSVVWPNGAEWVAAWGAAYPDGTYAVQLTHKGATTPFTGQATAGAIGGLNLSCRTASDCLAVYAAAEAGDLEVFEARMARSGETWAYGAGWPRRVSAAAAETGDLSANPTVAWTGTDSWVISMTDIAVPQGGNGLEGDSDIRGIVGGNILSVNEDIDANQENAGLVYTGTYFGLMYLNDTDLGRRLELRLLDSSFSLMTDRWTAIATAETGTLIAGPLILANNSFATVWVAKPQAGADTLHFVAFETCE